MSQSVYKKCKFFGSIHNDLIICSLWRWALGFLLSLMYNDFLYDASKKVTGPGVQNSEWLFDSKLGTSWHSNKLTKATILNQGQL